MRSPIETTPGWTRKGFRCFRSEREDGGAADAAGRSADETRGQQGHGSHVHRSSQAGDQSSREEHHQVRFAVNTTITQIITEKNAGFVRKPALSCN